MRGGVVIRIEVRDLAFYQMCTSYLDTHILFKHWTPSPVHTEFKPAYPITELELIREWEPEDIPR